MFYSFDEAVIEFGDVLASHGYSEGFEDTDGLNATLSMLVLCLLHRHVPELERALHGILFPSSEVPCNYLKDILRILPPCRWQKFRCSLSPWAKTDSVGEVEVVLDMGHNPAAIQALVKRANREYRKHGYDIWY